MRISVFIPVDDKSIQLLDKIVEKFNTGTLIPYEIVISGYGISIKNDVEFLKNIQKSYKNVYIYARKCSGDIVSNRNLAYKLTSGDIIMYHNPKMLPSVKKVEILSEHIKNGYKSIHHLYYNKDIFNNYNGEINIDTILSDDILKKYSPFGDIDDIWNHCKTYGVGVGADYVDQESITISRDVLEHVLWKASHNLKYYRGNSDGSCYEFSIETLYKYNKSLILKAPLTYIG